MHADTLLCHLVVLQPYVTTNIIVKVVGRQGAISRLCAVLCQFLMPPINDSSVISISCKLLQLAMYGRKVEHDIVDKLLLSVVFVYICVVLGRREREERDSVCVC